MTNKKRATPEIKRYLKIYEKISQVLVNENVNVQTAMIIVSAMSEAIYKYMVIHPEAFNNRISLEEILGLKGDDINGSK